MNTIVRQSKIITLLELSRIKHDVPKSWTRAAGLLRRKQKSLESHLKTVRKEWGRKSYK